MTLRRTLTLAAIVILGSLTPTVVDAGCGCEKPPPAAAPIRPAFASPGDDVTIFAPGLNASSVYGVLFISTWSNEYRLLPARAVEKRDLADGVVKRQLVVPAPNLPPGPTQVRVYRGFYQVLSIGSNAFTMLQPAVVLPEQDGLLVAECYSAAVGADGTVYVPVDVSDIAEHMIFEGIGKLYPLLFDAPDIAIYNTQGFLMQLLGPAEAGIYDIEETDAPDSFALTYDRHEFVTYRDEHEHEAGFGLDPADPAWHVDGTPHIDHDHLVLAIRGVVEGAGTPAPGATPPFDLEITTALAGGGSAAPAVTSMVWSSACAAAAADSAHDGDDDDHHDCGDDD